MSKSQKTIGDIVLKGSGKSFPLGKIRKGTSGADKANKIICYIIPKNILKDKDVEKMKKKAQELVNFEQENINVPEKVVFTKSNIYYVYKQQKKHTFLEVQEENAVKLPSFFTKLTACMNSYAAVSPKMRVVMPQSLRFDKAGGFVYNALGCEHLLKKKVCVEKLQQEKDDGKHDHPPEIFDSKKVKGITPETSLVYSIGALFSHVNTTREELDSRLAKKSIGKEDSCNLLKAFLNQMLANNPDHRPSLQSCADFKWTTSKKVSFDGGVKEAAVDLSSGGDKRKWNEKGKSLKTGAFDVNELEILKHSICRYVQAHSLGEQGLNKLITHSKEKDVRGAWTKISESLPNRTVQSCHNAARAHFHPGNYKGRWTEDEEQELLSLVESKGRKWQEIANILDRTPMNVRDKYKTLGEENSDYRVKGVWSPREIVELLKVVQSTTKINFLHKSVDKWLKEEEENDGSSRIEFGTRKRKNPYSKMFDYGLSEHIDYEEAKGINYLSLDWGKIAKHVKTRSKDDCKNIWYKQIFNNISSQVEFTDEEDEVLVNGILAQEPENDKDINFSYIDNGRTDEDNLLRWKQLSTAASSRALRSTSQLVREVRKYLKQLKESRPKKYETKKGASSETNELIELFKREYKE